MNRAKAFGYSNTLRERFGSLLLPHQAGGRPILVKYWKAAYTESMAIYQSINFRK
jgi:hypothetical protein